MDTSNQIPIRNSIKILLINDKKELLLMCAEDATTRSKDGSYHGRFWFPIGGQIESGETVMQATIRELYEETSLQESEVKFGPIVWFGEFEMILSGTLTRLKQQFIVAYTTNARVTFGNLTQEEKAIVKSIRWFRLEQIRDHDEIIYPVILKDFLPDILEKRYPPAPFWIDLGKKPNH